MMWRLGSVAVGLLSIAAGLLYAKQDSLLYFPAIGGVPRKPSENPRKYRSPEEHGIPFETHRIQTADGVMIHSWLMLQPSAAGSNPEKQKVPTLMFFHGNAG